MADANVNIFGIRHHGPGSARSLAASLKKMKPDCILLEGPPDADGLIELAKHEAMKPPVAILTYASEEPKKAVFHPFATFSPEWQAIVYGLENGIPVRFFDLPMTHRLAMEKKERDEAEEAVEVEEAVEEIQEVDEKKELIRLDPLGALAKAAGYADGERWWERMVEARLDDQGAFAAILEAMAEVRASGTIDPDRDEPLREAWMRQTLRSAMKEYQNIAVVCGAWHGPALMKMPPAKEDAALLKGLPKIKVQSTWTPWSYSRLTYLSGYGAGIHSPGWYEHLWKHPRQATLRWMTRAARLLREEDIDCSSAHVIEAIRLAETLASMRGLAFPGLEELNEASRGVFCFDSDLPMQLIARKLIVGEKMGSVPESAPSLPLAQDIQKEQKRLRLPPEELEKVLELDLRKENDLDRSRMLHRLNLLGISWGELAGAGKSRGTFKEVWKLRWAVEYVVRIAEMGVWGNTLGQAASNFAMDQANKAENLPALCKLVDAVLLADLSEAISELMQRVDQQAAVAADLTHLMDALPPLANISRYGNVRQTDSTMVGKVIGGLVSRICVGLPGACASLSDEAAGEMVGRIMSVHNAIPLLSDESHQCDWRELLRNMADLPNLHGMIAGRCCRLLLDEHLLEPDSIASRMSLALSTANDPALAAMWIEGFLHGSGLVLLHDDELWRILDQWVATLRADVFTQMLPILRRTFSRFPPPERKQMGLRAKSGLTASPMKSADTGVDLARAKSVIPTLKLILGAS